MYSVIETPMFAKYVRDYWTEDEFGEFAHFIARNPEAGAVVRNSGGVRKVRWTTKGTGKRGGARVIYYNRLGDGQIWLLLIYGKSAKENIPAHILRQIKEAIEND